MGRGAVAGTWVENETDLRSWINEVTCEAAVSESKGQNVGIAGRSTSISSSSLSFSSASVSSSESV